MNKKNYKGVFVLLLFAFNVCFVTAQDVSRSYYVSAKGNDQKNNGRTENTPFKTIKRAVEVASEGAIKRITVIGTLNQNSEGSKLSGGVFVLKYNGNDELIITGKEKTTQQEKAILSALGTKKSCVYIWGTGKIRFENIKITGANTKANGGGICNLGQSQVTLGCHTKIIGNITSGYGGGIYANGKWFIEEGVEITGNNAKNGGGIYIPYSWNKFTILGGTINNNKVISCGGGIYIEHAKNIFTMENGNITNNYAGISGGGIYIADESSLLNGKICNNTAKKNGGGIYMGWDANVSGSDSEGANVKITKCLISGNKSEFGAGIYFNVGILEVNEGEITNNSADFVGGAIYIGERGSFNQTGVDISKNKAGDITGKDIFKKK